MTGRLPASRPGDLLRVRQVHGGRQVRLRLGGLGIHPGDQVEVLRLSALGGPMLIRIHGAEVALGGEQAVQVEVEPWEAP